MKAAILDFGPYRCLKICNPRFVSLWASDSYGTVKSIHGGLQYYVDWPTVIVMQ